VEDAFIGVSHGKRCEIRLWWSRTVPFPLEPELLGTPEILEDNSGTFLKTLWVPRIPAIYLSALSAELSSDHFIFTDGAMTHAGLHIKLP